MWPIHRGKKIGHKSSVSERKKTALIWICDVYERELSYKEVPIT